MRCTCVETGQLGRVWAKLRGSTECQTRINGRVWEFHVSVIGQRSLEIQNQGALDSTWSYSTLLHVCSSHLHDRFHCDRKSREKWLYLTLVLERRSSSRHSSWIGTLGTMMLTEAILPSSKSGNLQRCRGCGDWGYVGMCCTGKIVMESHSSWTAIPTPWSACSCSCQTGSLRVTEILWSQNRCFLTCNLFQSWRNWWCHSQRHLLAMSWLENVPAASLACASYACRCCRFKQSAPAWSAWFSLQKSNMRMFKRFRRRLVMLKYRAWFVKPSSSFFAMESSSCKRFTSWSARAAYLSLACASMMCPLKGGLVISMKHRVCATTSLRMPSCWMHVVS